MYWVWSNILQQGEIKMGTKKRKTLLEVVQEISKILVEEELSAREVLMVLRMLETDATLVLVLGQLAEIQTNSEE